MGPSPPPENPPGKPDLVLAAIRCFSVSQPPRQRHGWVVRRPARPTERQQNDANLGPRRPPSRALYCASPMRVCFVVNNVRTQRPTYTTLHLAFAATGAGTTWPSSP